MGKFYLEELFNDSGVDLEETAYWFHTPPGAYVYCVCIWVQCVRARAYTHLSALCVSRPLCVCARARVCDCVYVLVC